MKLRDLTVDAKGLATSMYLENLHPGLNIVEVADEADARLIRHTVRQRLFDPAGANYAAKSRNGCQTWLDRELFDAFFTAEIDPDSVAIQHTGRILRERLTEMSGHAHWPNEAAYLTWQHQASERCARLVAMQDEHEQLVSQAHTVDAEIEATLRQQASWAAAWERQSEQFELRLTQLRTSLSDIERQLHENQLGLDHDSAELERAAREVRYEPVQHPRCDRLGILYEYLDDLEHEIAGWRESWEHVQAQRYRLRDEMLAWKTLALTNAEHPYHAAAGHLSDIASHLEAIQKTPEHALSELQHRSLLAAQSAARQLSDELGQQFRHLRHRAAAIELKQHRQHAQMIEKCQAGLAERKQQIVDALSSFDPAGASAIRSAHPDFIEYAVAHGYLSARRHFVGPEPATGEVQYRMVRPDVSDLEQRLAARHKQREELNARRNSINVELRSIESQRQAWLQSHPRPTEVELGALRVRRQHVQERLHQLRSEIDELQVLVAEDRTRAPWQPDHTLTRAGHFLQRLTDERVVGFRAAPTGFVWELVDARGESVAWENADRNLQWRAVFCLRLSACVTLHQHGIDGPFVGECILDRLPVDELAVWAALLREVAAAGVQIVLVTREAEVCRAFEGWEVSGGLRIWNRSITTSRGRPFIPTVYRPIETANSTTIPPMTAQNWKAPWKPVIYVDETREPFSLVAIEGATMTNGDARSSLSSVESLAPGSGRYEPTTPLSRVDLVDSLQLKHFHTAGIETLGDLLALRSDQLPDPLLHHGVLPGQINRWQAQANLLIHVPELLPRDARLLVSCGIGDVEQLAGEAPQQIVARVQRYLASPDGRRLGVDESRISETRVREWQRQISVAPDRTGRVPLRKHSDMHQHNLGEGTVCQTTSTAPAGHYFAQARSRDYRVGQFFQVAHSAVELPSATPPSIRLKTNAEPAVDCQTPTLAPNTGVRDVTGAKFYLNLQDPVEAAPSIGPKTADRFTAIGVMTIADFLRQSADSMAERIAFKRISGEVIRQWQQQTRLVLRVPNLRGHDAQLLVACGVTEAEQLAASNPQELYHRIAPFVETKEGIKIIRAGKKHVRAHVPEVIVVG